MKTKKQTHVKKDSEKDEENVNQLKQELSINDQLELFADIIIDHYLESVYDEIKEITD